MFTLLTRARRHARRRAVASLHAALPLSLFAHAAWSATSTAAAAPASDAETTLAPVMVSAQSSPARSPLDPNLPESVATVTSDESQYWNVVTPEDVLKYAPNMAVRKRFIGDVNAPIAVRGTSNAQTARGLVYADGLLLSNFLGNTFTFAPRWSMVFADDIARTDVIYGPYSALYPGNSIGATVAITTRMPTRFESDAKVQAFTQHFDLFGINRSFNGANTTATVGDRIGKLSFLIGVDHLENTGQPLQFATLAQSRTPASAADRLVTGATFYNDQNNARTAVLGTSSEGIERTFQDQLRVKLAYDITNTLQAGFTLGYWHQKYNSDTTTFLRDAAGKPVYSGRVNIGGFEYTLPAATFAPSMGSSENFLYGLSLRTHNDTGWNAEAVASYFDITQSIARTANAGEPGDGPGTLTDGSGSGWKSLDLRTSWTPAARSGLAAHALAFGYHYDNYFLDNVTSNTAAWRDGAGVTFANAFGGRTRTQAVYAQDAWRFLPRWAFTYGVRYENWNAYDGTRAVGATSLDYSDASQSHWSPKASLSFEATNEWTLRASIGRAYRFPTVGELFQGQINGVSIVNSNPNLQPEDDLSKELTAQWEHGSGLYRFTLFQDDVKNTILSQTNTTVIPNVTNFQNIDKVRSRGAEASYEGEDVILRGLDLAANVAYTQSKIIANSGNPASVGKYFYRIPLWRANAVATYRANARTAATLAVRYSGRQYNTLTNTDVNPDTYGGTSTYAVVDAKFSYKPTKRTELGIGVDNLFDRRYYVFHPYAGRTFYVEGRIGI
ncbi:TonB-dependent receptor [Caballeronia sp. LZ062]|uniref:TonB-dependent receptor n=1 Tax=unclassified Caballeronia TaxID=2646786 RepID=UPI00285606F6|nr:MULTISPECIES: TonB-dependent receptor [unclassified Caballeronia]MDR5854484.1 TonB-dependent receptor [Caballeronia sp. LZ050]MDR5870986.1 TonB-dependent receptor [Caballeronia sp. LZ062]